MNLSTASRCFAPTRSFFFARCMATLKTVPPPRGDIASPADFLKSIGRDMDTKLTVDSWDELWQKSTKDLKAAGMGTRDRRYTLWCMDKYRNGVPVQSFAHPPAPKKKIRGWGPAVQNGKRIRSKVQKTINKAKAKAQSRQ